MRTLSKALVGAGLCCLSVVGLAILLRAEMDWVVAVLAVGLISLFAGALALVAPWFTKPRPE